MQHAFCNAGASTTFMVTSSSSSHRPFLSPCIAQADVSFSRIAGLNRPEAPYFFVGCIASGIAGAVQPVFAFVVASFITIFYTNNPVSCLSATYVHMYDELNSYTAMQCGVFWQYCDVSSITRLEPHYPTLRMTYCLLKSVNPLAFLLLYFDVLRFLICHALLSMCFTPCIHAYPLLGMLCVVQRALYAPDG